jgi:hypothetical protein
MIASNSGAAFTPGSRTQPSDTVIALRQSSRRIVPNEHSHSWQIDVTERLEALVRLQVGWDGYGGEPVRFDNANFALRMLNACCGPDAPTPQIVPGLCGDLQIEWHTNRVDIELHVRGPNDVSAWRRVSSPSLKEEELELTTDFAVVSDWITNMTKASGATQSAAA